MASGLATVAEQTVPLLKPWKTDLEVVSAFDTSIATDARFSQLVEMEKSVAGLSQIIAQYDQITSISAQLASLQHVGLSDAWKRAIIPPELLLGLNDFALKQYEFIQRATDNQTIAWRLGLIDAASKFVDAQVTWGSALAIDSKDDSPEVEAAVPDFCLLQNINAESCRAKM